MCTGAQRATPQGRGLSVPVGGHGVQAGWVSWCCAPWRPYEGKSACSSRATMGIALDLCIPGFPHLVLFYHPPTPGLWRLGVGMIQVFLG